MKKSKKSVILVIIISLILLTTGCTKTLTTKDNKPVKNNVTGQNLTENILCKPIDKKVQDIYRKNNVKIDKLPSCEKFKITSGKYEGLWTSIFVKPLAFILLQLGLVLNRNYALSLIIISLIIRLI